jgi:hypothetical protein
MPRAARIDAAPSRAPITLRSSVVTGMQASAALAVGAMSAGALAIGVLAVGRMAIGRLALGRARIRRLEIDELVVRRLRVVDIWETPDDAQEAPAQMEAWP